jgi:hypothetical protein
LCRFQQTQGSMDNSQLLLTIHYHVEPTAAASYSA